MTNARKEIEKLKSKFLKEINKDLLRFKRSIIRQLDYLARDRNKELSQEEWEQFLWKFTTQFKISAQKQKLILNELKQTQNLIAEVWDNYFGDMGGKIFVSYSDYEKMIAAYSVDFKEINKTTREAIIEEVQKATHVGLNYEELRSKLIKRDLGDFEARTLSNTAIAQFDNAYLIENAEQAGIGKFLYDGVLHPSSRQFCKERVGKTFTLKQIEQMDNGQGLSVLTSLGGYNCTHYWTPVVESL